VLAWSVPALLAPIGSRFAREFGLHNVGLAGHVLVGLGDKFDLGYRLLGNAGRYDKAGMTGAATQFCALGYGGSWYGGGSWFWR
jgi:hypothetical protein